jgi:hypothetical protein
LAGYDQCCCRTANSYEGPADEAAPGCCSS